MLFATNPQQSFPAKKIIKNLSHKNLKPCPLSAANNYGKFPRKKARTPRKSSKP